MGKTRRNILTLTLPRRPEKEYLIFIVAGFHRVRMVSWKPWTNFLGRPEGTGKNLLRHFGVAN
jgi:hypothetical protein